MKNIKLLLIVLGMLVSSTVLAVNITVPASTGAGYYLVSTSTGAYTTTTNPIYALSGTSPITFSTSTGVIGFTNPGYISSALLNLTSSSTEISFSSSSDIGTIGLAGGYSIPLTASTTNWESFYQTPSGRITAGNLMEWSSNTLNSTAQPYYWLQSGSNLYPSSTSWNVGIGTASPANKLDVEGSAAIGATYSGTSAGPTNGLIIQGNVGIATSTPAFRLDIAGDVNANGSIGLTDVDVSAPFTGVSFNPALTARTWGYFNMGSSAAGGLQINGIEDSGAVTSLIIAGHLGSTTPTAAAIGISGWKSDGGTGRTALTGSEIILNIRTGTTPVATFTGEGNVGIGTTTPSTSLYVLGSSTLNGQNYLPVNTSGFLKTNSTGLISTSTPTYPIQFIIENPTASENDNIFIFNTTSTITKVLAVNKSAADTVTFGLGYSTSQGTATSSLTNLFAAQTITSTSTPTSVSLTAASSTPGLHNVLKFWTTAASSTQFALTIYYTEN